MDLPQEIFDLMTIHFGIQNWIPTKEWTVQDIDKLTIKEIIFLR